jgi:photosystem II stability/assembly factor-like uncharacterized protein
MTHTISNKLMLAFVLACLVFINDGMAQVQEYLLQGLEYRSIGPSRGGRSSTAVGVPGKDFTFFMGATGGGVWKTDDAGTTWSNVSDGQIPCGSIGAIAIAPSDPNVIYVGTGSPDPRGNVSMGIGMYKSVDGGENWQFIGLPRAGQIGKVVIHPDNPDELWVGVLGNVFGTNPERGVYHSKDGGKTWNHVLFISEKTGCIDLAINPGNPRILYAGMWTAERKPWTFIDGSDEGGVWKSEDGGINWERVENGLPVGVVGRVGLAISPANPDRIWVIQETQDEKKGGIYRSDDGGNSFTRINREHKLRQRAWYYNRIIAHPTDENIVFVTNVGFFKSIDGGKSFDRISVPHGDNHGLWINPENPDIMIEVNDGGACVTLNGGKSWSSQNNQPTAEFYRVSVDNDFPYRVYGAQQDNSTISVPSIGGRSLTNTSDWEAVGGGESGHIAVHPEDPDIVYAGTYIGTITRMNKKKGIVDNINAYPQMHDGQPGRDIKYRFQWNAPIRISPHNADVVYHCSQYVHKTIDGGKTWEIISPDLTTNKDEYQDIPGMPIQHDHTGVELYTTIFAFEESPMKAGELWAGTDDGRLHISMDGGDNWKEITPGDMPLEGTINSIDLSPHAPGRAFIAVYKYRENDFNPYIFMTNDYGKNWKKLTDGENGIKAPHFVRVVREDRKRKGLLYAGTEFGMYVSFDEGQQWQSFQQNLPVTPITDIALHNNDLVIATQGRSFWIMDDLSPIQNISEDLASANALLDPEDPIRFQVGYGSGFNYGANIYFTLNEEALNDTISLTIVDHTNQPRMVYSNYPDKEKDEKRLKVKKGLNHLNWNLKYEGLESQPGSFFSLANTGGIKAPIGEVTVQLHDGDQIFTQKMDIKADPRWTTSKEDFMDQYNLATQVKETFNTSHKKIGDLRSVRTQIEDKLDLLKDHPLSDTIHSVGKEVLEALNKIEDRLIQTKNESGQDPINYPSRIDDQIAYLYSVVNSLESKPGAGAYERYEDLSMQLQPILEELEEIMRDKVTAFATMLAKNGLSGIIYDVVKP